MDLEKETDNGETADLCLDDLKLEQVSFAYEKEKYVLKDVDILFEKAVRPLSLDAMVRERQRLSISLPECMSQQVVR